MSGSSTSTPVDHPPLPPISHLLHRSPQQTSTRAVPYFSSCSLSLPPLEGDDPPMSRRSFAYDTHYSAAPWRNRSATPPYLPADSPQEEQQQQQQPAQDHAVATLPSSPCGADAKRQTLPESTCVSAQERTPNRKEDAPLSLTPRTQVVFDASGRPVLKRKRGRPPSTHNTWQGGWVFLAPTVWTVHSPPAVADPSCATMTSDAGKGKQDDMQESMTAFTGPNLDMVLPMPRKKRGRKPKHHLVGHSCFVWRDIPPAQPSAAKKSLL